MPFEKLDVKSYIQEANESDPMLKEMWDSSRSEYRVLGDLAKVRKEMGLSQAELAQKSGNRQQVISRIENKENSPTLKTLCGILDVLNYDICLVPRNGSENRPTR